MHEVAQTYERVRLRFASSAVVDSPKPIREPSWAVELQRSKHLAEKLASSHTKTFPVIAVIRAFAKSKI